MKQQMMKSKFGDVREITAENYVDEVNKAGEDVWVALLLYQNSSEANFLTVFDVL